MPKPTEQALLAQCMDTLGSAVDASLLTEHEYVQEAEALMAQHARLDCCIGLEALHDDVVKPTTHSQMRLIRCLRRNILGKLHDKKAQWAAAIAYHAHAQREMALKDACADLQRWLRATDIAAVCACLLPVAFLCAY